MLYVLYINELISPNINSGVEQIISLILSEHVYVTLREKFLILECFDLITALINFSSKLRD